MKTFWKLLHFFLCPLFFLNLISCRDDEGNEKFPFTPRDVSVFFIEERFDSAGHIYVNATVGVKKLDTIQSYGFIYTDGLLTRQTPQFDTDHVFYAKNIALTKDSIEGFYGFDALINPERISDMLSGNSSIVNIAAFIKTTTGNLYVSRKRESIAVPKLRINSVYPRVAAAGVEVKVKLNRRIVDNGIYSITPGGAEKTNFPLTVLVNAQSVPFTVSPSNSYEFSFQMPSGIGNETPITLKAGDFRTNSSDKIKNALTGFKFLTKLERQFSFPGFMFATSDAIFSGAGSAIDDVNAGLTDFWKYDLSSGIWSQITDKPSNGGSIGMSFVYNGLAYCGTPTTMDQYNPLSDTWTRMAKPIGSIQYNNTFGQAPTAIYNNKLYFTNYSPEVFVAVQYHNFYEYDFATQLYKNLAPFPGEELRTEEMDKAVVLNNQLHFFGELQHWVYTPSTQVWSRLADVSSNGDVFKAFGFNGRLYGIIKELVKDGTYNNRTLTLLIYDPNTDTWSKDADIPLPSNYSNFYLFSNNDENVYLSLSTYDPRQILIYKVY